MKISHRWLPFLRALCRLGIFLELPSERPDYPQMVWPIRTYADVAALGCAFGRPLIRGES